MTAAPLELTDGHWVQRPGGVRVWEAYPDADLRIKALPDLEPVVRWHVTGVRCPDCGCLLRDHGELCPACVIPWCRDQETRWNRQRKVA